MAWQPIYKSSGKRVNRILNDAEKTAWEQSPISKGLFRFEEVSMVQPPRIKMPEPVESKRYEKPPRIEAKEENPIGQNDKVSRKRERKNKSNK